MLEGEKICFLKIYSYNLLANINKFEKYTLCGGGEGGGIWEFCILHSIFLKLLFKKFAS